MGAVTPPSRCTTRNEFYRRRQPGGLDFPKGHEDEDPDYWDFVYFSFVIGMTAQYRTRRHRQDHPPHCDGARHHLVRVQYGAW